MGASAYHPVAALVRELHVIRPAEDRAASWLLGAPGKTPLSPVSAWQMSRIYGLVMVDEPTEGSVPSWVFVVGGLFVFSIFAGVLIPGASFGFAFVMGGLLLLVWQWLSK